MFDRRAALALAPRGSQGGPNQRPLHRSGRLPRAGTGLERSAARPSLSCTASRAAVRAMANPQAQALHVPTRQGRQNPFGAAAPFRGAAQCASHSGLLEPRGISTVLKDPGVRDITTWSVIP
jgi:hypothetical protein